MDYGFHHNKPTEVRLVKSTKAIIIPAPDPVLYHRMTVAQRASGKKHYIETSVRSLYRVRPHWSHRGLSGLSQS